MTFDATFFLLAIPAVIFAGISKGGFGSGAAFVAGPILALIVDPMLALGIMLPLLMLIDVASLKAYWRKWSWSDARLLLIGSVPGILAGAVLSQSVDPDVFRMIIGMLCLLFVVWQIAQRSGALQPRDRPMAPAWGAASGVIAGLTSFISHAGGPIVAFYLLSRGLGKTTYQATTVVVFWAINVLKFVPYAMLGFFTSETLTANLLLAPAALLGTWIGVQAHRLVPERLFFGITYVLLATTGSKLIWDALT
jgi:uncharacterized membrane protein YfcA